MNDYDAPTGNGYPELGVLMLVLAGLVVYFSCFHLWD